ncbi:type II toxin-antitoxin system HipA family toxin [Flavobacterium sp. Root420]|uniref:type II toxin-antitoxin system HipA family toxin n=1 Tax=Flavobacterium sp. Root420 TaxID=1736533 RepID=UPI0006F5955C|nr:HipA domain-containing protein [Flavobacterium sp. Root420]KQX09887.1 toxin HipA [Flavobacterium sp. Root420]
MAQNKFDIYVYAHWIGMQEPELTGVLSAHFAKGKKSFSFEYDRTWIKSKDQILFDPDIQFYSGPQFPSDKENFGIFLDSMPDTWGRTLMKRRVSQQAKENGEKPRTLYDIDYLLGVYDESRMGALRFKTELDGPFLDNNNTSPTPPWSSIRELQNAAKMLENDDDNKEIQKWLSVLMAPGSSLGGARPKANILDENKELWIAKFPSKNDTIDKGAWEMLAYELALKAGINMAPSKIEKIAGKYNTFFTKRFDREKEQRIHFASAMTMTSNSEDTIRDNMPSYLDIADFIQNYGVNINENLQQLWRRIIFNIAVSNTDDHLRNHGFILTNEGWILSPAYDINPSIDKDGLALNIDTNNNELDFNLAISVGEYFRLDNSQMDKIINEVIEAVSNWKVIAQKIGISRAEQELMTAAFIVS